MEKKEINKEEIKTDSWFDEYDKPQEERDLLPIFEMKLKDGKLVRSETIVFLSEGNQATTRFGETIIFNVRNNEEDKVWFIKKQQYSLLNPIAKERKKGSLVGREAEVQRTGSKKETRWAILFKE